MLSAKFIFQFLIYNNWISNETLEWKNNLQINSLI